MSQLRRVITIGFGLTVAGALVLAVATTAPVPPLYAAQGKNPEPPAITTTARSLPALDTRVAAPAATVWVTTLASAGPGSLRAALWLANSLGRRTITLIDFRVRGVIRLRSGLPVIARTVFIDGTSAPGYVKGRAPVVELNCGGHAGLVFAGGSGGSRLLGLAVGNAGGDGVTVRSGSFTLNGDYLGLNLAGRALGNHGSGLYLAPSSAHDLIGLNPKGLVGVVANVVSGNWRNGVVLNGSREDTLVSNRIGTNRAGSAAIPNRGDGLRLVNRANSNEIGGTDYVNPVTGKANNPTGDKGTTTPVFVVPPLGNLISGNLGTGVVIAGQSDRNELNGNFVGTTANGNAALGNGGNGVLISHANRDSLIGCKFVNNPFVYYNVVSANRGDGLLVSDANNITVQGNFFGTGANNATVIGNHGNGVHVTGTSRNTQVGGVIPLGNVSGGNYLNGIAVTGRARGFVTFNTFGGLFAFGAAAPNRRDGIFITSTGGDNLVRTNVMSGNRGNGIELAGFAHGVTVDPDIAGLQTDGESGTLPNGGDGLLISGYAHRNVVGGSYRSVIRQNTFSGNRGYGLAITGHAYLNHVFGAYIGTFILGANAAPNAKGGVLIGGHAHRNVVGTGNIISGNTGNGVTLRPLSHLNKVVGNLIGLNRLRQPLPNGGRQVVDRGAGNTIRANRYPPR